MHYCSCYEDALRTNPERPWVSPSDTQFCKYVGLLGQFGHARLTATQVAWLKGRARNELQPN
jgi:hypothetical protein